LNGCATMCRLRGLARLRCGRQLGDTAAGSAACMWASTSGSTWPTLLVGVFPTQTSGDGAWAMPTIRNRRPAASWQPTTLLGYTISNDWVVPAPGSATCMGYSPWILTEKSGGCISSPIRHKQRGWAWLQK
jgi:hypothetical protein